MVLDDFLTDVSTVTTLVGGAAEDAAPYILGLIGVTLVVGIAIALLGKAERKIVAKFK